MRITNVSADVNSQKAIRQQPIKIGEKVRGELNGAEKVEASEESVEAEATDGESQDAGAADSGGADKATSQKKGRKAKRS